MQKETIWGIYQTHINPYLTNINWIEMSKLLHLLIKMLIVYKRNAYTSKVQKRGKFKTSKYKNYFLAYVYST